MAKKVMTVDDSATVRQILRETLSEAGYSVVEASNGFDAVRLLTEVNVDMLVTDLNMPRMNGIDLIRTVRKLPGYRFMPIIMLTTESQDELKMAGKDAGASGWVTKPFRPDQLLAVTRMVCPKPMPQFGACSA